LGSQDSTRTARPNAKEAFLARWNVLKDVAEQLAPFGG